MSSFGVLSKVELRQLWPNEAWHFTTWLAENLGLLGEALGLDLEMQMQEAPVGPFSLDILARDLGRDRPVIIENQLEATDHDHLGKLLTYAAGHDAAVAIWVAPAFRDEHRQALDWLNQRTDMNTEFFGVVVEALQIDDSRPAPNFRLVAFPNDWRKSNVGKDSAPPTARGEAYRTFYQSLIDRLRDEHRFTQAKKGQAQSWYSFASGMSDITYGLTFIRGNLVQVETYIGRQDRELNKWLFDALYEQRSTIEAEFGEPLSWERLDARRASRVAIKRSASITDDPAVLRDIEEWGIERLLRMKRVMGPKLESLIGSGPLSSLL
ncbi:MAG: DUF4268 domain-containing protein [Thermomicrobiales bacterium]